MAIEVQNPMKAPVIPITETVIFPGIKNRIYVNETIGNNIKHYMGEENTLAVGLTTKGNIPYEELNDSSFYRIGVLFQFNRIEEANNGGYVIEIFTLRRVEVLEVTEGEDHQLIATYGEYPEWEDMTEADDEEMTAYIKNLCSEFSENFKGADYFMKVLDRQQHVKQIMGYLVPMMSMSIPEKQALLEINSQKRRALKFIDYLIKEKDSVHLQLEISKKYAREKDKNYRNAMLREQLHNIEAELGEDDGDESQSYRERVEASDMPENVKKVALREVKKLEAVPQGSSEMSIIMNYLDLLLDLPWTCEPQEIDINEAKKVLDEDHYGLEKVKERIIEHLAVMKMKNDNQGTILLLVGPPGTGKTSLGRSIARALNRKYVRASLGGVRDESEIRGHRRTYIGALPGRIIKGIRDAKAMNPVFVLDEIDKLGISAQGDPSAALLEVLDPEQNNTFSDHYLEVPYDLSNVFFICTANDASRIPGPLLDRAEIIELSSYTNTEKQHIAEEHLVQKVIEENGLKPEQLSISKDAISCIIEDYTAEAGVRGLTKQLAKIARMTAEKIVTGEAESVRIEEADVEKWLGHKKRYHEKVRAHNAPGVVTGMAWTAVGGEILFTEATFMPGSGRLIMTGQLGDVMKESATIAMSLIRSRFSEEATGFDYSKFDTHIHVPEGATPKDGPSAGVTITTALASLILGKSVDSHLSMTGEITLSGNVLPVGGIKEKVIAAQRAGVKKIILPKENKEDLEDVPKEVTDELTFVYAETIDDVLKEALGVEMPKYQIHTNIQLDPHKKEETDLSVIL
ncbi:endopeptidase La [Pseudoramibacter sp.]|jgi:ATP-dependent Lon protease|uniref:endopeptidase La n=1 Tax=Pseudoramibacter sp. TaxID=2034862 RepID=UPI0025CD49E7|nr:endopeptidase La [Pseudoramibacter sp.]MCH4072652.1 endopeptidase La [Pseudoramibacter sp.]MCH4106423.1 endopeptidase La [Pseudoramibacter sp.]